MTAVFMCSFGCGLSWEHLLEWAGRWTFLFLFKLSWLNLERKWMRLGNSDFLSFLRNCDLWKHVTGSYSHNKWWPLWWKVKILTNIGCNTLAELMETHFSCLVHDWPSLAQLNLSSTFVGNFHLIKTTVLRSKILTTNLTKPIHFPIFVTVLVIWICGTMDFIVESRY